MNLDLLEKIKPGKEYSLVEINFKKIKFIQESHTFSPRILRAAAEDWKTHPGRYNSIICGFKKINRNGNTLIITVVPMPYSLHRYITKRIHDNKHIDVGDKIFIGGVTNLTIIRERGDKRYFVMGLKKKGNLGEGTIECIPQGFCDYTNSINSESYVEETLRRELREEVGADITFKKFSYLGLAIWTHEMQYAILTTCEILDAEKIFNNCNKEGNEHDDIFLVPEQELEDFIQMPKGYGKVGKKFLLKERDLRTNTKALLYYYLKTKA